MNRRSFIAALSSLPLLGWLRPDGPCESRRVRWVHRSDGTVVGWLNDDGKLHAIIDIAKGERLWVKIV